MKAIIIVGSLLALILIIYLVAKHTSFFAKGGYKVGDRVGNDCLCSNGVWADECCKKGRVRNNNTGISY